MTRLGIIGGGQLGQMLALAAAPLGIRTWVLDPVAQACAMPYAEPIVGAYDNPQALARLAQQVEVATFEFENVPPAAVAQLAKTLRVAPGALALATASDRWHEKALFHELGIATAPVALVNSTEDLQAGVAEMGLPAILKTRTLGYDGKGQIMLRSSEQVISAWDELGQVPCVLEGFVPFDEEISCLGVRSAQGELRCYDVVANVHDQGILYRSQPMAKHPLQATAEAMISRVMVALDYVGVLALELFRVGDQLLANEMAPRVHNSGHWSIEGAVSSQFENHVRAVCGLPLGETRTREPVLMLNVYGAHPDVAGLLQISGACWHDYGKSARPGRKLGHVTVVAASAAELAEREQAVATCLRNER